MCGCMGLNVGGGFAYNLVTGEKNPVQPDQPFTTAPQILSFPPRFLTTPIGFIFEFGTIVVVLLLFLLLCPGLAPIFIF